MRAKISGPVVAVITYTSPAYSITAPCINEDLLTLNIGCSGTTLHSKNFKTSFFATTAPPTALNRFFSFSRSPDLASRPARLTLTSSDSQTLCRLAILPSSSSVERGRMNSREVPPDNLATQPRMVSVPGSSGVPAIRTTWKELAGMTTWIGSTLTRTPDVL